MKRHSVIAALVVAVCLWVGCNSAFAAALVWQTTKAEAVALAKAQGKKILLVGGSVCCDWTTTMREKACEINSPPIKSLIEQYFIPWYGEAGTDYLPSGCGVAHRDWYSYAPPGLFYFPLIAVIDPNNSNTYLDRTTGEISRSYMLNAEGLQAFYTRLLQYTTATTACTFNISPSGYAFNASSNTGTITVTPSASGCSWTALSNAPWITITAGSPGAGNGTVSYSVAANTTGGARTGTMTIGGKTFTVTQNGSTSTTCAYAISPTSSPLFSSSPHYTAFGTVGNTGTVEVATSSSCSWSVTSKPSWITITAGNAGAGNGTVSYSVSPNTGSTRTGTMTIGGKTFTVTQDGAITCTYNISPASSLFNPLGHTGTVAVTPSSSCSWSAASSTPWITIAAGSTGTGSGTVSYSVAANTTGSTRTGSLTIGGQPFTVTQTGANTPLYFPHIDTSLPWQTEIALINTSDQPLTGTLRAWRDDGVPVGTTMPVTLSAHGRRQITVANEFTNHTDIGYITFDTDSAAIQGYTKLYQTGSYRAAIPAVKELNTSSNIYISHIASNAAWRTWVSLVNTNHGSENADHYL